MRQIAGVATGMARGLVAAIKPRLAMSASLGALALGLSLGFPAWLPGQQAIAAEPGARSKPQRAPRPSRGSIEYRLSWGLSAINAYGAYARGVSGSGITVALIDTGITGAPAELFGRISPASIDLVPLRRRHAAGAVHGARTAGLLAGKLDGERTVGVAYGATLLAIRADIDGSCEIECAVRGRDLARGIDYALAHGARIIGIPLVGDDRLESVEPALERAVSQGAVIVAAAGNRGSGGPSWPARYAADPRFTQSIVVAGASTLSGELASWSSRALATKRRYIAAPGEKIAVDCDRKYCKLASGTSFSVAYVAGALSLLLEAQPQLTPSQAATVLLASASDRGRRGIDEVSGTGIVDVSRALRLARRQVRRNQQLSAILARSSSRPRLRDGPPSGCAPLTLRSGS